eukprot:365202-Chlamydomonas_euryale.AAC.20
MFATGWLAQSVPVRTVVAHGTRLWKGRGEEGRHDLESKQLQLLALGVESSRRTLCATRWGVSSRSTQQVRDGEAASGEACIPPVRALLHVNACNCIRDLGVGSMQASLARHAQPPSGGSMPLACPRLCRLGVSADASDTRPPLRHAASRMASAAMRDARSEKEQGDQRGG